MIHNLSLRDKILLCTLGPICLVIMCLIALASVPAWIINIPIRKCLGYPYRNWHYYINKLAPQSTCMKKGFRYGAWNPFNKDGWY